MVDDHASLAAASAALGPALVVGLDCEWRPFSRGMAPTPVSLLQVATPHAVFLFDLLVLEGESTEAPCPLSVEFRQVVSELLSRPGLVRLGFGFGEDMRRLKSSFPLLAHTLGVQLGSSSADPVVIDLHIAAPVRDGKGGRGLAGRVQLSLGANLDKRMQVSDWGHRPLSPGQVEYAALDARCLIAIYEAEAATQDVVI